jgi:cell division protein FtsQ
MRRTIPLNAQRSTSRRTGDSSRKSARSRKAALPVNGRKQTKPQRGLPPVLVRSTTPMVQQPAARKQGKARRRYDVALSMPGAEVRLPALPELRLGWRLLSGAMVLVLAGMLYFAWTAPIFQVEALQISGMKRIFLSDFDRVLGISGEPVFLLHPEELRQELAAAFPELSAVDVKVSLPAEVIIEVVEREPVLRWFDQGKETWVDAEGYSFPPRGETGELVTVEGPHPPMADLAEGEANPLFADPTLVAAVLQMAGHVPPDTPVVYDLQHGLGWSDWHGWQVYFGFDLSKIDMKLKVYESLLESLDRRNIQPELISLEFIHAPYYRLER